MDHTSVDREKRVSASEQDARLVAVASNLRIDAATAEVMRALDAAGVGALLLKGPALSAWYADDPTRSYMDCDLWVQPGATDEAGAVMEDLGFKRYLDERELPEWWREHAYEWSRDTDGVIIDLHRNLQGLGVDSGTAWAILASSGETVVVAGCSIPTLSTAGKAMYVALHAAHHGEQIPKALIHLERALRVVDEDKWRDAASLAQKLNATNSFAAGLRLLPTGWALADRLGLGATASVNAALHASTPPPIALGFEHLASSNWRVRASIVRHKFLPPAAFMRHWWPPAARNRGMLLVGYAYRPLWLLRNAPQGWRAWRDARRRVRAAR
jgi:GNAT superfamily N-acetyltransferase